MPKDLAKEIFKLPPYLKFDPNLLPAIQNLTALGYKPGDIGIILGYAGDKASRWINDLKNNHKDVGDALDAGRSMANTYLISQMFKAAAGYEHQEVEEVHEWILVDDQGREIVRRDRHTGPCHRKKIKTKERKTTKVRPPSSHLAVFLAINKLGDEFAMKSEINRKTINIDLDSEDANPSAASIRKLASALLKAADRQDKEEIIDAEPVSD